MTERRLTAPTRCPRDLSTWLEFDNVIVGLVTAEGWLLHVHGEDVAHLANLFGRNGTTDHA
jgi:hypothetical protein